MPRPPKKRIKHGLERTATHQGGDASHLGPLNISIVHGTMPHAITMGGVGFAALGVNAISFWLLWHHRVGDANMRSAWICTRNDVLGNLAVLLAALGVFGTGTGWPDVIVAAIMAVMALQGAITVIAHAAAELRSTGSANFVPIERR